MLFSVTKYFICLLQISEYVAAFLLCCTKPCSNILPISYIPNGFHIIWANILVLQVVSMFPDINTKERYKTCSGLKRILKYKITNYRRGK